MKLNEVKLGRVMGAAVERHKRQAREDELAQQHDKEIREQNQASAAFAAAATLKDVALQAKLTDSQDQARATAAKAEADVRAADNVAAKAEVIKDAVLASVRRMQAERKIPRAAAPAAKQPQTCEPSPTVASAENTGGNGKGRVERQFHAIITAARDEFGDVMKIPRSGKAKLKKQCMASHPTLFCSGGQFDEAWKKASLKKLVRMAEYEKYTRRY